MLIPVNITSLPGGQSNALIPISDVTLPVRLDLLMHEHKE